MRDERDDIIVRVLVKVPTSGGRGKVLIEDGDANLYGRKDGKARGRPHYGETPNIILPENGCPAYPAREGRFICVRGDNARQTIGDVNIPALAVYAKIYDEEKSLNEIPTLPLDLAFLPRTVPYNDDGEWEFDGDNLLEVTTLNVVHTLAIWAAYVAAPMQKSVALFTPFESDTTACEYPYYHGTVQARGGATQQRPSAYRWKFTVVGARNLSCTNCGVLNQTWVVTLDHAQPDKCRWLAPAPQSFASSQDHVWWRLQLCRSSGFWYLDCVQHPDMPLGSWISYRCHESSWRPHGANKMTLHSNGGYCEVPRELVIEPA